MEKFVTRIDEEEEENQNILFSYRIFEIHYYGRSYFMKWG